MPPVPLPVGAVIGVVLPVGPRGHAEPAGVAVPVLPRVGHSVILITSEHAAAEDTDAVVGPPVPYDRRHATFVSLLFGTCDQTNRLMGQPALVVGFESRARDVALTAVVHRICTGPWSTGTMEYWYLPAETPKPLPALVRYS